MFLIDNYLQETSFGYDQANDTHYLGDREDELLQLQEIVECCRYNSEKLICSLNDFFFAEVEPDVSLADWLFGDKGEGSHDARELLRRMLDMITECEMNGDGTISIALGTFEGCASTKEEYMVSRRRFLAGIRNVEAYGEFMKSCFQESVFSDNIMTAMKRIPDFEKHTEEITFNLALLNDCAISVYKKYDYDGAKAMKELTARALECTGDPAHKEYLRFPFTYEVEASDGSKQKLIEEIECSPHMKLIRRDSDLRIYFYWYNEKIEKGQKVLIGRIGSHPY